MKLLIRKIQSFQNLSPRQKKILILVFYLSVLRIVFRTIGSKKAFAEYFKPIESSVFNLTPEQIGLLRDITKCIVLADKYIPWPNVCRHQAWQAVWLLRKYQIPFTCHVGVKTGENGIMEGHAWVIAEDIFISGYCASEEFKIIFTS